PERVDLYLSQEYHLNNLKIKPVWDIYVVGDVRRRHPGILLSVDANCAYTMADEKCLRALDDFDLLMIEQPLDHDDLIDHAKLQSKITTPICLDETITSAARAKQALDMGSCQIINIKIGRVGGY